ncbi:MAG: TIGR02452 family protein [Clostridia bacterium]|nr:TIGR02452 family protein [Clostridia bacterium]
MQYVNKEIKILENTLEICKKGVYVKDGKTIDMKLSLEDMENATVFLPDEINKMKSHKFQQKAFVIGRCGHNCENIDSFSMARKVYQNGIFLFDKMDKQEKKEVLVLNFANPVNPGGGVRRGAKAQEEDLCRKSSLLLSLESKEAEKYYQYNKSLNTPMGSDAIIITPKVEIIKDENNELLDESAVVAVMTCAAPMIKYWLEGLTNDDYQTLFYNRILGMLRCAAVLGYKFLVLGAFGCGAFGNDAKLVSDLFYKALKEIEIDGLRENSLFRRIDFAVLDPSERQYNFKEFYRNFGGDNFFREEIEKARQAALKRIAEKEKNLDKIKGSMIGGAAGDALGYAVEFLFIDEILNKYGKAGITEYQLDYKSKKALISDDTQMALFTANGILFGETRGCMRGIGGAPYMYMPNSYQDWLITQKEDYLQSIEKQPKYRYGRISWLLDVPELHSSRAPGNTCLSSLREQKDNPCSDYIAEPINDSKGCGGVMRVAPLGLWNRYGSDIKALDYEAARISAITHGHSLGYMTSSVLVHIINRIVFSEEKKVLKEIVTEAIETVADVFKTDKHIDELKNIVNMAVELSENTDTDINNITKLGAGWVAEETLAIAIYCSLKYQNDFSKGIIAAVNHSGDSDSTGTVAGNILGALVGYNNIESKWKTNLELFDVISEMATDLCHGCQMSEYGDYRDDDWIRKYINRNWK